MKCLPRIQKPQDSVTSNTKTIYKSEIPALGRREEDQKLKVSTTEQIWG